MTIKKLTRREVIKTYSPFASNRFNLLDEEEFPSLGQRRETIRDRDAEVNEILTPKSYAAMAKHRQNKTSQSNKKKVIEVSEEMNKKTKKRIASIEEYGVALKEQNVHIVSEMEKLVSEMIKFASDAFRRIDFPAGVTAFAHFDDRLKKFCLDLDHKLITNNPLLNIEVYEDSAT